MKKRIKYLDTAKGILILFMLFGHVFLDGLPRQIIYSFHMPAFFIISGILIGNSDSWKEKNMKSIILNKTYSLIIPFCFFELIGVLTDIARFGITLNAKGYLLNTLTMNCNNGPDWFLYCLFIDEIILIAIYKYIKNDLLLYSFVFIIGFLLIIFKTAIPCAGQTGIGLLFLFSGFIACRYYTQSTLTSVILTGFLTVILSLLNGKVDMAEWFFGSTPLYILGSLVGSYFIINISKYTKSELLKYYGKNTLIVLGTHQAFLLPIRHYAHLPVFPVKIGIIIFILVAITELPIIFVFNRYIPFLCGKRNQKTSQNR